VIRVLIVDDSAFVRKVLTEGLSRYADIQVVGSAMDPYIARRKIAELRPDVITLDIEMPRMDGLSFLEKLMRHYPVPVVIVSSLTPENSETALRALELGAVDVIRKPGSAYSAPDVSRELVHAIRAAAAAKLRPGSPAAPPVLHTTHKVQTHKVVAIGASTGGPRAIETILRALPADSPGIVIVQHMPQEFTAAFADRLNQLCSIEVREARHGDPVGPGVALIAPGDRHMILRCDGAGYSVQLKGGPPVHYQRPSVDVLFLSVARSVGPNAVGVLLTGMGSDGARGLSEMKAKGAHTIVQDEASSAVFGMPREAIRAGAAMEVLPLDEIAGAILRAVGAAADAPR